MMAAMNSKHNRIKKKLENNTDNIVNYSIIGICVSCIWMSTFQHNYRADYYNCYYHNYRADHYNYYYHNY